MEPADHNRKIVLQKNIGHFAWQHDSLGFVPEIIGRTDKTLMVINRRKLLNEILTPCASWRLCISSVLVYMLVANLVYPNIRVTLDLS